MIRALLAPAALFTALSTIPAVAQTCSRPPAPAMPDGATASDAAMSAMPDLLDAYIDRVNAHLTCLEQEDGAVRAEVAALLARWEAEKQAFAAAN